MIFKGRQSAYYGCQRCVQVLCCPGQTALVCDGHKHLHGFKLVHSSSISAKNGLLKLTIASLLRYAYGLT